MNFQRGQYREHTPEKRIPMIAVLLVILIFRMITTTYSKFSGLETNLPTADATQSPDKPNEINVAVTAAGAITVNKSPLAGGDINAIAAALRQAAGDRKDPVIVINADAKAAHQSVVDVMQAAQSAGYPHISFATKSQH